ncbi:MAG: hypothetical protein ACJZ4J_02010 [Candidatus Poseidoniales archaeon]
MRKAVMLVGILMLSSMPVYADEPTTIHLWSEQAPGPVLLWQYGGDMITVDPNQPIDLDLPTGDYFFVRLVDGVPQMNRLLFNQSTNVTDFLQENLTHWSQAANQMIPGPASIEGYAHLDVTGPIARSELMNATWTSSTRLPASLGHPELTGAFRGIVEQMELNGFEDQNAFSAWVINNTEIGCCAYDQSEMIASNISVTVAFDGPVWGWDISADLVGQGDGRSTRLVWIPVTGSVEDHNDLRITLPEPHEIRYSPQEDYITGTPDDFVIHRGDIPVTGNATIALGTNVAPVAGMHVADGELPWLPFGQLSQVISDCTDNSISEPVNRFILRDGNTTLLDQESDSITIDAMFLDLTPSSWLNLTLECTDPQGLMANQSMDVYIDGVQPSRTLQMQYLHPDDIDPVDVNYGNQSISIPSGAVLSGAVQAGDDSDPPVDIEWTSNKSSGWIHLGIGNHAWNDIFVQGEHINGQHLSIEDRHRSKSLTVYSLQLNLTDAAGNVLMQDWDVVVTDRTSPTPRPALSVDGNYYGDLNHPIEGGSPVDVSLDESWDDIDAIEDLTWTVEVNGETLDVGTTWNEVQSFTLPQLTTGRHTLVVNATDTSGNTGTHSMMFVVEPPLGALYRITDVVKVGDGGPGEPGALNITIVNDGQGESYFRLCYLTDCTSQFRAVEASVDGPGEMTHSIPVTEWASGEVIVEIQYSDNTSSQYQSGLMIEAEMTPLMWILLMLPPLIGLVAFLRLKKESENEDT